MCTLETNIMSSPSDDPHLPQYVNGCPVLQPPIMPPPLPPPPPRATKANPLSTTTTSTRPSAGKWGNENNGLNSSTDKVFIPKSTLTRSVSTLDGKKSRNITTNHNNNRLQGVDNPLGIEPSLMLSYSSSLITESPGSFAANRSEQIAFQHAQRKMKIAHYGRSKSAKYEAKVSPFIESLGNVKTERRCTSVTTNSDPVYVAYHDEEWGVPVHDDKILFELLVLSGAQVGSDWTSILRKRQDYRDAFSEFDAEVVGCLTEKQMVSISGQYAIDISRVRGVVDNAKRILQIRKEFGSFDKYIWGFVNGKPISPQYKFAHKIPVKTSKSESISKDMVRRGFRIVGPTAVHYFMQAAGLTNDHLITCYRHLQCTALGPRRTN